MRLSMKWNGCEWCIYMYLQTDRQEIKSRDATTKQQWKITKEKIHFESEIFFDSVVCSRRKANIDEHRCCTWTRLVGIDFYIKKNLFFSFLLHKRGEKTREHSRKIKKHLELSCLFCLFCRTKLYKEAAATFNICYNVTCIMHMCFCVNV